MTEISILPIWFYVDPMELKMKKIKEKKAVRENLQLSDTRVHFGLNFYAH